MLTHEGSKLLMQLALGDSTDTISGWRVRVSDGSQEAFAPLDGVVLADDEGWSAANLTATFGELDANFEWTQRDIVSSSGVVVDTLIEDLGRKAVGAEWQVEAILQLAGEQ